jgi:3-hydroxybutyryl-CoA dehydratase
MVSTNWILSLLVDVFGPDAATRGRLRTKYIAPIYEDQVVIACAKVDTVTHDGGNPVYDLTVWCEDDRGKKVTVGDARVYAAAR